MEKNNISALEEQFIQECKLINLNYEYPGYTGEEKWAIISDLTEEDIMRKYAELIQPYSPFLLLNSSFGEIRKNYIRNEKKHQMLGLGKTDSYWLVHKRYFKTVLVGGKMRILVDSFEEWYAGQFHYKKVDGTKPGKKYAHTMSVYEMADLIGRSSAVAYDIVKRGLVKTEVINGRIQVDIQSFEEWLASQSVYSKVRRDENV